jgi:hypothetical protein
LTRVTVSRRPDRPSRRVPAAALALFALSLALKIAGILVLARTGDGLPLAADTRTVYRPMALGLLGGDGYRLAGDARDATRIPPLTPMFLAVLYLFLGTDPPGLALGVVGAVLRAATTTLVYLLGRRLLGHEAAVVAALLHAVDPWEAVWAAVLLKDSLALLLFVAATLTLQAALDRPSWKRALGAGGMLGMACLARYAALGFVAVALLACLLWVCRGRLEPRAGARVAAGLGAGLLLALGPWLAHNRIVLGEIAISTHFAGRSFYVGNAPGAEATGSGYAGDALPDPALIRAVARSGGTVREGEWRLFQGALRPLGERPGRVIDLLRAKLVNMWRPTYRGASSRNLVLLGVPYVAFMALALAGLALCLPRRVGLVVPYGAVAYHLAAALVFYSEIRQRQFLMPFLALFAGCCLLHLARRDSRERA